VVVWSGVVGREGLGGAERVDMVMERDADRRDSCEWPMHFKGARG